MLSYISSLVSILYFIPLRDSCVVGNLSHISFCLIYRIFDNDFILSGDLSILFRLYLRLF